MKKLIIILSFTFLTVQHLAAQCAMCKASAETSMEAGVTQAAGVNTGVLYVLFFVFAFLMFFIFLFTKGKKYLS